MKNLTLEEGLIEIGKKAQTQNECAEKASEITEEIMQTDERLYSCDKKWTGYGTWKVTLWCNEYHFGLDLTKRLEALYIITHDEEKKFSLEDFKEEIDNVCFDIAYEHF
jgi:hypothetical protein